jgi:hypothetical protein
LKRVFRIYHELRVIHGKVLNGVMNEIVHKNYRSHMYVIFFFPPLAIAVCAQGNDHCIGNDTPSTDIKKEDIALLVAATVLAGSVVWYLMSDKENENIHNYITTDLFTTNERYKFSLAPIAEGGSNGLALQFSYAF